jgi:hypothetical protein
MTHRQHPRISALEAVTQSAVGILLGLAVTTAFLGSGKLGVGAEITAAMFIVSSARGYVIRRLFDRIGRT